jgi:hypothetical protein
MAVVKLTASKKAIQFIDDEGNCFQTSTAWLAGMVNGNVKHDFILLSRLPMKVSEDRFKKSPVWGEVEISDKKVESSEDALSVKSRTERQEAKGFEDKKVW